jgi:beta-N-acetylhexosaminidase
VPNGPTEARPRTPAQRAGWADMRKETKKKFGIGYCVPVLLLALAGASCAPAVRHAQLLTAAGPGEDRWVRKTLAGMTLEEKIGQMIGGRYNAPFVSQDSDYLKGLTDLVTKQKVGGMVIFGGEVYETAWLNNYLQSRAKIPLLIAADFENGAAMRINGATLFPPFMALGAAGSEDLAYQQGRITAAEGRAMGIHVNYAPVVDVNIDPDNPVISTRSAGEDPERVSRLAVAFIRGSQENGMPAAAKHFPGHGDTAVDSHSTLPTVVGGRERLDRVELYPFARAIEAGVEVIMTAHLYVPALDPTPGLPATLSPVILTELLRKQMGFKGLVVTDAMEMGGVTSAFPPGEAALKAVRAGVDMVLLPPDPPGAIETLVMAVSSGRIPESRIDESVRRILRLKARLGLHRSRYVDPKLLPVRVASKANLEQAVLAFEKSATLVKNEGGLLPLNAADAPGKLAVFSLSSDADDYYAGRAFIREVQNRRPGAFAFYADAFTGQEFIEEARTKAADADDLVIAVFSSLRTAKGSVDVLPRHIDLVRQMARDRRGRVIVISFGSPYFLRHFPEVGAYLCLYRSSLQAQRTAARAVFGEIDVQGRLPVSIPGLFPAGHGVILDKK